MGIHLFLVTSSTCATYLWSNMAVLAPVITSAFQLVGQKIILPFGSDIPSLLKFHEIKYLHGHGISGGSGSTEGKGNVIIL